MGTEGSAKARDMNLTGSMKSTVGNKPCIPRTKDEMMMGKVLNTQASLVDSATIALTEDSHDMYNKEQRVTIKEIKKLTRGGGRFEEKSVQGESWQAGNTPNPVHQQGGKGGFNRPGNAGQWE